MRKFEALDRAVGASQAAVWSEPTQPQHTADTSGNVAFWMECVGSGEWEGKGRPD